MAVSRISEQEMADRPGWVLSYPNLILGGRRRVRETLGLPPDELDDSVPNPRIDPFTRADDLARGLAAWPIWSSLTVRSGAFGSTSSSHMSGYGG
jgi:hypothetical protein